MTQEDKQLLLKDLSARLPYNTKVFFSIIEEDEPVKLSLSVIRCLESIPLGQNDIVIKPYLRPLSSMTKDEENEWNGLVNDPLLEAVGKRHTRIEDLILRAKSQYNPVDWLNAHHFDYRGLIPMGLAIAVTKENNPYNE